MNENENNLNPVEDELPESTEAPIEETPAAEEAAAEAPVAEAPATEAAPAAETAAAAKPKFKLKPPAIIAGAVAVVAAVVIGIASAASSPVALLGKSVTGTVEAAQKNEIVSLVTSAVKGGSAEVLLDLEELMDGMIEGSASVKMYTNDKKEAAVVANVEVDDESVLDAGIYADMDNVAVASEVLFGEDAYGISLKNLTKNFEDSVFGPDGEYSLGIEITDEYKDLADRSLKMTEDAQKLSKDVLETMVNSLKKHGELDKSGASLNIGGKKVKATAVRLEIDEEGLASVVVDLVKYIQKDKAIKAFLEEYLDMAMLASGGEFEGYDDKDELIEDFYSALEEVDLAELEEMLSEEDISVKATFFVSKSGKELVGVDFTIKVDGERVRCNCTFGPSWETLDEINIHLTTPDGDIRFLYEATENTKKEYASEFTLSVTGNDALEGTFEWDKKEGDFELEVENEDGDTYGAEGNLLLSSKELTLVLDSVSEDKETIDLGVTLILKANDKMPSMPKYTDVLKMSEDELEDLIADLQDVAGDLFSLLYMF